MGYAKASHRHEKINKILVTVLLLNGARLVAHNVLYLGCVCVCERGNTGPMEYLRARRAVMLGTHTLCSNHVGVGAVGYC